MESPYSNNYKSPDRKLQKRKKPTLSNKPSTEQPVTPSGAHISIVTNHAIGEEKSFEIKQPLEKHPVISSAF